jgi:hypothetical protein
VLHLANSPEVENKIADENGRVAKLVKAKTPPAKAIEELYLAALARLPNAEEQKQALDYLAKQKDLRRGLEDVLWALVNSKEFMFSH